MYTSLNQKTATSRTMRTILDDATLKALISFFQNVIAILNDVLNKKDSLTGASIARGYDAGKFRLFLLKTADLILQLGTMKSLAPPNDILEIAPACKLYQDIFGMPHDQLYKYIPDDASEKIEEVLQTLSPREQDVLHEMYFDGMTLEEVGKTKNVTKERIRQIQAKSLRKLRHPSRSRRLLEDTVCGAEYDFDQAQQEIEKKKEELAQLDIELKELENKVLERKKKIREINDPPCVDVPSSDSSGNPLASISLEDMQLSVRSYNCLRRVDILNAEELMKHDIRSLFKVRNLGRNSLFEIVSVMDSKYGLRIPGTENLPAITLESVTALFRGN